MGSTGEPDRKRRHFSSISPTAAATTAKKQPFAPLYEDKKVDTTVLQFQNQKLVQKLEAQRIECIALENKFSQLRVRQQPYDNALAVIDTSLEQLVDSLDSCLIRKKDLFSYGKDLRHQPCIEDGASFPQDNASLRRLLETGATDSNSANDSSNHVEEERQTIIDKMKDVLRNLLTVMDGLWSLRSGLHAAALKLLPEEGVCRKDLSCNIETEVKNLRLAAGELHLKHKSMEKEIQHHRDADAKNKAQLKRLRGELECAIAEWEESNSELATLKAERDATKGAFFPILNVGSKSVSIDRGRDKQKDLTDMESALKELLGHASSRLVELKRVHEERIEILKKLIYFQNTLKSVKYISSSQAYVLLRDQLVGAKSDLAHYQALYEKLQVEKDNLAWRERELNVKNDLVDVFHWFSAVANSRITELGIEIQKQISDRNIMSSKLEASSREPGRKEVIAGFKALVSTFPEDMGRMQSQLSKYKESATDVHSLRANVLSLLGILDRKAKELETLSGRSADQIVELNKLRSVVVDLKVSDMELKLILDMYQQESIDTRDVLESRDSEFKAWAHVQSLKSSLDEHNLELRVKSAIEAEAFSQQRLAASEAEIANLRQKLEVSKREKFRLADVLKSKHEENEAYLSEIQTIGQAYDDMQTQNQRLLQQITERDDYNIKLVLEGVLAKQMWDSLLMEKQTMQRAVQQSNACADYFEVKASRIEDQVRMCLDQVHKLAEDRVQFSVTLENIQKKLLDVRRMCQQQRESLEGSQSKVDKGREVLAELPIELEEERFEKKRVEEDLEVMRRKALLLRSHIEGSSVVVKLQQELKEYKDILKCSICLDRPKEVVITKCYHLFCNPCVQKVIDSRHRKCLVCATTFGANDVKPVYI